ncbi:MAG: tRNA (adenosine(37)-N6)-threonylcarbamoyltransferase complex transferase subunit TsaD [Burkholderiales bacterium]
MLVLGIETSCDETGVALYDSARGLLAHALHSQVAMHQEYGGVVPELASRDHIRRLPSLLNKILLDSGQSLRALDAVAYTAGPGLAGALLVGASAAKGLAYSLGIPAVAVHHLEGHLLAPFLSGSPPPLPFVALLVSGGHTQLMRVAALGNYELLGETLDDAAGEAFDKTAQLLGLGYPGGPALAKLACTGDASRYRLPRPMLHSDDLNFSFSGLKTAVLTTMRREKPDSQGCADLAACFQDAVAQVLAAKTTAAMGRTGIETLVVAGGVGANLHLRAVLNESARKYGFKIHYPALEFCTDNGAMIALAGALRLEGANASLSFGVRPRWDLAELPHV